MGVGERLERGERLRRNDEQRLLRVEVVNRLVEMGAIHVGHEPGLERLVPPRHERPVRHQRAEVGSADADVHDGANALAGVPGPFTAADAVGEATHVGQNPVHVGDDVLSVDHERRIGRCAQRRVKDRTILGRIDVIAPEHRLDLCRKTRLLGERNEQIQRLGGDEVLRGVDDEAVRVERELRCPVDVAGKQ